MNIDDTAHLEPVLFLNALDGTASDPGRDFRDRCSQYYCSKARSDSWKAPLLDCCPAFDMVCLVIRARVRTGRSTFMAAILATARAGSP